MPSKSNQNMLEQAFASIEAADGLFVVDYRGLTVKDSQELRRALTAAGANMKVYKNNIVKLALGKAELPTLEDKLEGTCAYVFYQGDPVPAAKAVKEKSNNGKVLNFVAGIVDGKALDADEAKVYADLASRDELLAQLLFVLQSPMQGVATAVQEIAKQKDEQAA